MNALKKTVQALKVTLCAVLDVRERRKGEKKKLIWEQMLEPLIRGV